MKSALVFGGRSPIALELCNQLVANNYHVHLATRIKDESIVKLATENGCAELHECDFENLDDSITLASKIDDESGGLNAVAFLQRFRGQAPEPFKQYAIEVNTPFQIIFNLARRSRTNQCSIVLATSPAADRIVDDQDFQYHASKAAITQLVRYCAVNFAPSKIRTNGVNPGTFVYKSRAASYYAEHPEFFELIKKIVPIGRITTCEEIACTAMFLLGQQSSNINGQIINIDGGLSSRNLTI